MITSDNCVSSKKSTYSYYKQEVKGYRTLSILILLEYLSQSHYIRQFSPRRKRIPYSLKMKAVILLAVLACVLAVSYGDLVCGTNYCKQHPCNNRVAQSSCRSPSVYRQNHSGKCACCPACVTLLPENSACKTYSKELGETPSSICRDPLKCLGGVCTKVTPRSG